MIVYFNLKLFEVNFRRCQPCQIILLRMSEMLCTGYEFGMALAFIFIVATNVGTIIGYRLVPIQVYFVFPGLLIASTIAAFLLKIATDMDIVSTAINNYRFKIFAHVTVEHDLRIRKEVKEIRSRFRVLRPCTVKCGNFYPLKRGSDIDFFFYACLRTVDCLLLFNL